MGYVERAVSAEPNPAQVEATNDLRTVVETLTRLLDREQLALAAATSERSDLNAQVIAATATASAAQLRVEMMEQQLERERVRADTAEELAQSRQRRGLFRRRE